MLKYELFQEWLDSCPVDIVSYNDRTDLFDVIFHVVEMIKQKREGLKDG